MTKLKTLLIKHGITQTEIARLLGRDKAVVTNLLQGKRLLKAEEAVAIADYLRIPVSEVLGTPANKASGLAEPTLIPFHHPPASRKPARNVVKKGGKYYLEEQGSFGAQAYALEVKDDSLNLSGILPGDIVISDMARACKPGDVVVAQLYKGSGATTVVRNYAPPFLVPHSTNTSYGPLDARTDAVRLVSPVVRLIRQFGA